MNSNYMSSNYMNLYIVKPYRNVILYTDIFVSSNGICFVKVTIDVKYLMLY